MQKLKDDVVYYKLDTPDNKVLLWTTYYQVGFLLSQQEFARLQFTDNYQFSDAYLAQSKLEFMTYDNRKLQFYGGRRYSVIGWEKPDFSIIDKFTSNCLAPFAAGYEVLHQPSKQDCSVIYYCSGLFRIEDEIYALICVVGEESHMRKAFILIRCLPYSFEVVWIKGVN